MIYFVLNIFRTDVYVISKMLADLPFHVLYAFIFIAIPYYPIGFNPAVERFLITVAIMVIVANVATSFGNLQQNDCPQVVVSYSDSNCRLLCIVFGFVAQDCCSPICPANNSSHVVRRLLFEQRIGSNLLPVAPLHFVAHVRQRGAYGQSMVGCDIQLDRVQQLRQLHHQRNGQQLFLQVDDVQRRGRPGQPQL